MFGAGAHTHDERQSVGGRGRSRRGAEHSARGRRRARLYRPGHGGAAFELLEERRLLSTSDLTQEIDNLLNGGTTTGSVPLGDVSLGSFLSAKNVTATFDSISQNGANWSGTIEIHADTASLNLGSEFTGAIKGDAQTAQGIIGTYSLGGKPLGQGAYSLGVTELDVTVPNVLTGTATGVQLSYDPGGSAGQVLAQVGSLAATLTALDNVTAKLDNLEIDDNGFKLADGSVTADTLDTGSMLAITSPTVSFTGAAYTVGGSLSGTIGLASSNVTLFPGKTSTATVKGFRGSYDLTQSSLSLSADSTEIDFGTHATVTADNLAFTLQNGGQSASVTVGSATADLPDLNITGSLTGLTIDDTGFSIASATVTDSTTVAFGSVLSFSDPTVTFTGVNDSAANGLAGDIDVKVQSASLFPGKANNATVNGFDANIDLSTGAFVISADDAQINFGSHVSITADNLSFSLTADANTPGGEDVNVTVGSATAELPDLNISGSVTGLAISNTGFSVTSASFTDHTTVALGSVLSFTDPTVTFTDVSYSDGTGLLGDVGVSVTAASLLPNQSAFSATVDGFSADYDFTNNNASVGAKDATLVFGKSSDPNTEPDLTLTASDLGFSLASDGSGLSANVTIGSAEAKLPKLNVDGSISGLTINNDGLSLDGATVTYTGAVTLGSVFSVTNPSVTFTNFGYSVTDGPKFGGLGIGAAEVDLTTKPSISAKATDITGAIDFTTHDFTFSVGTLSASIGQYLSLSGSGIHVNTAPAADGYIAQIDSIGATLKLPGNKTVSGSVTDLAIAPDGSIVPTPGGKIGGSVSLGDSSSVSWPSWLPIQVTHVGIQWPSFSTNPTDFVLDLSASVNASIPGTTVTLGGSVTDAQIDTGLLENGDFPIVGLGGASVTVGGTLFGATVSGTLFVAVLNVDSHGNVIPDGNPNNTTVANHYLYGGIEGKVDLEGLAGLELRLGVSQFGLLDGFVDVNAPILLDPDTGLAITNLHAGIEFGQALPAISDAHLLNPANAVKSTTGQDLSALTPPGQQTAAQWEQGLKTAMAKVAAGIAQGQDPTKTLYSSFVLNAGATVFDEYATEDALRIDGDVLVDTTGKLEITGAVTVGDSVSLTGAAYIDLSQVASGKATLLLYAEGPSQAPIVTTYGSAVFQYNGPHTVNLQSNSPDLGTGLSLNGSTDDATADNINLNTTSYTVEFWAKRADTGRTEYVIGQADASTANDLQIGFDANNRFFVAQNGQTLDYATTDNNWHHWAVTFNQASDTRTIYRDGQAVASDTASALQNTSTTLLIGKSGSTFFDGSVDEVRVWSVARAAADVQANYQLSIPATTAGLIADWNFNEGQGTIAADSSGNGNTATLQGTPAWAITLVNPPTTNAFASFTITIGGEIDLTVPDLPVGLQATGSASFTVTPGQKSLDLTVSGHAPIPDLGLDVGVGGNVHFDVNASGTPELYGILQVNVSDLQQLKQLGITVQGTAVLEFNTTASIVTGSFQLPSDTSPTTFNYSLPAQSTSLSITGEADITEAGQTWFALQGQLYAFFGLDPATNSPLLQFYVGCNLLVGPSSSPVVEFQADGFLQISSDGIAAHIGVTFVPTPLLAQAGIDLTGNTFDLELNTTKNEVKFSVPQLTVPAQTGTNQPGSTPLSGTIPNAGHQVDIPAGIGEVPTPQPYLSIVGNANINIEQAFVVGAHVTLLVVPGSIALNIDSLDYTLQVGSTVLDQFTGAGGLYINDADPNHVTFAAALELQQRTPFSSGYGFGLNASFALEANTTGQLQTLGGIAVPAKNSQGSASYAEVHVAGDLMVGGFDLNGTFEFLYSGGVTTTAQIIVSATASLGPLGSARAFGNLTIQTGANAGVYGVLEASLQGTSKLPVNVNAALELELNTTGQQQTVSTVVNGQVAGFTVNTHTGTTTPASSLTLAWNNVVTLVAGGTLTLDGVFNLQGEFGFTASNTGLNINANADLTSFFGANLSLSSSISIIYPSNTGPGGLVVNAGLAIDTGSLGVGLFSITASPRLMINTTGNALNGVDPNTYEVALQNASLNVFGFHAGGSLTVGVHNGLFEIDVPQSDPLSVGLFGLGDLQAYGYFRSNGQFSITGSLGIDIGQDGNELYGSISATISNTGFSAYFSGGASLFHVNLASASGWLSINNGEVDLGVSVWIIGIQFGFNFHIGHMDPPPVTTPTIYFYGVPASADEGSSLMLSAGAIGSSGSLYPDGDYQWTVYRNGQFFTSGTGANDKITLGDPGQYLVQLNVDGLTRSSTVQVNDVAPTIQSTGLQPAYTVYSPGSPLTFTPGILAAVPSDVPSLRYTWTVTGSFGGAPGTKTFNGPNLTLTPDPPGNTPVVYQVTLTVADGYGGSTTATSTTAFFNPSSILVNTIDDQANPFTANGVTYVPLRAAIAAALNPSGVSGNVFPIIKFDPSLAGDTITLTQAGDTTDNGRSAFAVPSGHYIELDGSGAPGLTLVAAPSANMRFFYVAPQATLTIFDLNLTGGEADIAYANDFGGAIYADGGVSLYNSALYGNHAIGVPLPNPYGPSGLGGAVYVGGSGSLSANETTFANNSAVGADGYLYWNGFYYQQYYGGQGAGGAIYSAGSLILNGDTIASNSIANGANALYGAAGAGVYDAFNTPNSYLHDLAYSNLVAQNSGGVDYYITNSLFASGNSNLVGSIVNAPPNYTTLPNFVVSSANPQLGPLADHGDGIKTFSLLPGSPAIGIGTPGGVYEPTDGRGYPHNGPSYDIGAFQTQPYLVTNTNDSGPGSLRAAAAQDDNGAPIQFAAGLAGKRINLTSGPIVLNNNVTINGPSGQPLTVSAAPLAPTAQWTGGSTQGLVTTGAAPGATAGPFAGTQAFQFNGNGSVTAPDNGTLDSPTFTVGGWFKLTQLPTAASGSEYYIASKYGGRYNGWILRVNSQLTLGISVLATSTQSVYVPSSTPLALNQWFYIAASYDGTTVRLYVNGVQTGSGTLAGGYTPSAAETTYGSIPSPAGLTLGGASWYSGGYAAANVANFAYFNTSLDAASIAGLAQPSPVDTRAFVVPSGVSAAINGLTITGGHAEQGGGIYNAGSLALNNDDLSLNTALGLATSAGPDNGLGGAVYNAAGAYLIATNSTFDHNSATGADNLANVGGTGRGGAVYNAPGAVCVAANDTFAANSAAGGNGDFAASGYGGAIDNAGNAALADDTIAGGWLVNGAGSPTSFPSDGIAIENEGGATLSLNNTIVAHRTTGTVVGNDVFDAAVSLNGQPAATVSGAGNVVTSSIGLPAGLVASKADPNLGPLGYYGGPTPTFAPRVGSPAIDAGNTAVLVTPLFLPGILHEWTGNGTAADSLSGYGYSVNGGVSYGPGVGAGQAFNFSGNGYIALPTAVDISGTGPFSVSAWIKTSSDGMIINQRDVNYYNGEYQLSVQGGKVAWTTFGDGQYGFNFSSVRSVNDNNWHLVTAVRLPNGTGEIFIDGALDNAQAAPPRTLGSQFRVYVGVDYRNLYYGGNPLYFNGEIAQLGLYGTALTPAQAGALYAYGAPNDQRGFARVNNGAIDIGAVEAQPYVVTNTNDSGPGSLRAAITGDLLGDQPVLFSPTLNGQTITLTSGPIIVNHDVTVVGPGASLLTVSGGNMVQDLVIDAGNVNISGLTIANGFAAQGGGIYNAANLTLTNDVFTGDTAQNDPAAANPVGQGGAIYNAQGATLSVTGSTFTNNFANGLGAPGANPVGQGGAIFNAAPTVNAAGVVTTPGGVLSATDNTFNGNAAQQERRAYGTQGYSIVGYPSALPSYATVSFSLNNVYTWSTGTYDPRAPQTPSSGTAARTIETEYSSGTQFPLDLNVNLTDGQPHTVSLYMSDYDSTARSFTVYVLNSGGYVLDSRAVTAYHNGVYLSWALQGNISFQIQGLSGANSLVTGVFIDAAPAGVSGPATFVGADTITEGNWRFSPPGAGLGGAIDNEGTATLVSDTVDGNSVASDPAGTSDGAGVQNGAHASLTLYSTIVANDGGGHDVANLGTITGDRDLVMSNTGVPASVIATSADPKLGPLANNGGPTQTMALLAGSPAIDAGDSAFAPATDQRGLPRVAGTATDIGAYEFATPIIITNTNDSGPGSLRAAIGLVPTYPGSPITFAPSLAGQTIHLANELYVPYNLTIDGSSAPGLVIQGNGLHATNGSSRDLYVYPGVTATIRNLTFTGGYADIGGGIENNGGTLTLQGVTVDGNTAFSAGGGVDNAGSLTLIDSTIAGNMMTSVAGWPSLFQGVGVYNSGYLTLEGDTIAGNTALVTAQGGGLANGGKTLIRNTIVYGNTAATGSDVSVIGGNVVSLGHNLFGTAAAGAITTLSTDLVGVNSLLGPLQNNGGPTQTMALLAGSPAIDAGDPMGVPATDQRGFARSAGSAPDIGAYERQPFVVTSASATGPGSLAQALAQDHDGSPITFASVLAGQTILFGGTVPNGAGTQIVGGRLLIASNVTIDGSAAPGLILSGGNAVGVLEIAAGANVTLKGLSIEYGSAATGGGILVDAGATLTLNGDTIAYNTATGNGGGVENLGTLSVVQSTFANNMAGGNGGGIDSSGTVTLESATLGHNTASVGGGLSMEGGTVTAHNSIIGDNTAPTDPDLKATLTSLGFNMIGNAQGVTGTVATDLVGVDPQLGPLANNGGPTQTLAPAATSAAIDGGDPSESLTTDQRGLKRDAGLATDVGALESQYVPPVASPGGGTTGYMIRAGQSLTLNAGASYDPEGLPLTCSWDVNGDGKFGDAIGVSPTLTWAQLEALGITPSATPYQVRVRVSDGYAADSYAVISGSTALVILPGLNIVSLTASATGPVNTPVDSATVTFSSPIDPATLNASDLSFTLDGGPNLINEPLQVQPVTGTLNTYQITGLSALTQAQGQYTLTIDASGVAAAGGSGRGAGTASVSWLLDTTQPDSNVAPLAPVQASTSFAVTAVGEDTVTGSGVPNAGLVACDLYVSTDSGPYVYWTTVHPWSPTALFQGQQDHTYAFYSIGHDAAGNHEPAQPGEATTFVPDLTAPVSQVTAVDSTTPVFKVGYTAADTGGSGLDHVNLFVQVDAGTPQVFARAASPSGTADYQAIVDGHLHVYRFYSIGVDRAGNVQAMPGPKDGAFVTATFPVAIPTPRPTGLDVQHGQAERSYVRYVDILFNQSSGLQSLIDGNHVHLIKHDLNGHGATVVPLTGELHVVDRAIEIDFGPAGIGGSPNSTNADGYYEIRIDGATRPLYFDRLLGDVNGDGTVNAFDLAQVARSLGRKGATGDVNGDGLVTLADLSLMKKSEGNRLAAGLPLSD